MINKAGNLRRKMAGIARRPSQTTERKIHTYAYPPLPPWRSTLTTTPLRDLTFQIEMVDLVCSRHTISTLQHYNFMAGSRPHSFLTSSPDDNKALKTVLLKCSVRLFSLERISWNSQNFTPEKMIEKSRFKFSSELRRNSQISHQKIDLDILKLKIPV